MLLRKGFRPLSGSYISQLVNMLERITIGIVSVPYRGATFLNTVNLIDVVIAVIVSVPYRGATFLNSCQINTANL